MQIHPMSRLKVFEVDAASASGFLVAQSQRSPKSFSPSAVWVGGDPHSTQRIDQRRGVWRERAVFQWGSDSSALTALPLQSLPVSRIVCCIGNVEEFLLLSPRWLDPLNGFREGVRARRAGGKRAFSA